MRLGRTALTVVVAGCALSASAMAQPGQQTAGHDTIGRAPVAPSIVKVKSLRTGQEHVPGNKPRPRGPGVVPFDNLTNEDSSAMLNVAYAVAGSYDGTDPSTNAFLLGLSDRIRYVAPSAGTVPNSPTDIVWDEYFSDPAVWPGDPASLQRLTTFETVPILRNNDVAPPNTTVVDRQNTLRVLFFNVDGSELVDGFEVTYDVPANFVGYFRTTIDLQGIEVMVGIDGLVMLDWVQPDAEPNSVYGCGVMFAGGDLLNTSFPAPESLVTVGTIVAIDWAFADGVTGAGGAGTMVDPNFDMLEGVSYLDVLNTGFLIDWQFTIGNPVTGNLTHDFPKRFILNEMPSTGACVLLEGQICFETTVEDCTAQGGTFNGPGTICGINSGACCVGLTCQEVIPGICEALGGTFQGDFTSCANTKCTLPVDCPCDFNDDTILNSQDFFDFLTAFFTNAPAADYNGDTLINSQDFFDFLTCFFTPPEDCN